MFDKGRPLVFGLTGQKYYHIIESGNPAIRATSNSIEVGPELLSSGESWVLSVLADGPANVHLAENYLPNVKIRDTTPRNKDDSAIARTAAQVSTIIGTLSAALVSQNEQPFTL